MNKKLYRGTFNYSGHVFRLFTKSSSKDKAYLNFTNQISKRLKIGIYTVRWRFNGSIDNYLIEEIKR